jgi:hypothetical protein
MQLDTERSALLDGDCRDRECSWLALRGAVTGARALETARTYGRYGGASPQPHRGTGACSIGSALG